VCWSIVVKEKPTVGYPFFWAFPSDRILKATKGVNVHFFIHNFPEIFLRQRFQYITHEFSEDFETTAYLFVCVCVCVRTISVHKHSTKLYGPNIPWEASHALAEKNFIWFQLKFYH